MQRAKKRPVRHMRISKAQISMRIRAVYSGHSLFVDIFYSISRFCQRAMKALISLQKLHKGLFRLLLIKYQTMIITHVFFMCVFYNCHIINTCLTLVLPNPDISYLCKQCRSRSVGFWRSQLIWICTVFTKYVHLYQYPEQAVWLAEN